MPPHLRQLISDGAQSGKLPDILVRYVDINRSWVDLGSSIRLALAYPLALLSLMVVVLVTTQVWLAPKFLPLYAWYRLTPAQTRFLLWMSGYRLLEILAIAAGSLVIVLIGARMLLPAVFRRRLIMRIPLLGAVLRWRTVSTWARLMELLLNQGTPAPEALQLAGGGAGDANLAAESTRMAKSVAAGQSLADSLAASRQFPASLVPIVQWGEETGGLPEAFRTAGDMFESRAQMRASLLQSALPPIMFVVIALVAIFLLNSLYMQFFFLIRVLTSGLG